MSKIFYPIKWSYYLGEQRPLNQIVVGYESDITPTPTPTPSNTPSPTPTPTLTPTPTTTPSVYYYNVFNCNDPFGPSYVVKSVSGVINSGQAVKIVGNDIDCWEIIDETIGPEIYTVSSIFADCATCQA